MKVKEATPVVLCKALITLTSLYKYEINSSSDKILWPILKLLQIDYNDNKCFTTSDLDLFL